MTAPVRADEPVDVADYETALTRPATLVTTDDAALQAVLAGDFARWQVFLHPLQRKIVERSYNGPARVSGGPGTGKTIVALHRVKHPSPSAMRARRRRRTGAGTRCDSRTASPPATGLRRYSISACERAGP